MLAVAVFVYAAVLVACLYFVLIYFNKTSFSAGFVYTSVLTAFCLLWLFFWQLLNFYFHVFQRRTLFQKVVAHSICLILAS